MSASTQINAVIYLVFILFYLFIYFSFGDKENLSGGVENTEQSEENPSCGAEKQNKPRSVQFSVPPRINFPHTLKTRIIGGFLNILETAYL